MDARCQLSRNTGKMYFRIERSSLPVAKGRGAPVGNASVYARSFYLLGLAVFPVGPCVRSTVLVRSTVANRYLSTNITLDCNESCVLETLTYHAPECNVNVRLSLRYCQMEARLWCLVRFVCYRQTQPRP